MEKITIIRPVTVKAVVTDNLKKALAVEAQEALRQVEMEIQQLESAIKKTVLAAGKGSQASNVLKQLEEEREKRLTNKEQLLQRLKDIGKLPLGHELVQGTVEGLVEVQVGQTWGDLGCREIVVQDNRVVALRNPGKNSPAASRKEGEP